MPEYRSASGSAVEDLFIDLFADTFGAEKAGYLYSQYPFYDIYQNARFTNFVLENGATRVAIEIDDEASHNPRLVSQDKFYDDLLKQNSMIHLGWDVYRWAVRQMQKQPETVKDELRVFLGSDPRFKEIEDYLPTQQGRALKADQLELREHQQEALDSLETMRQNRETIALLYHATGTGKTVTAVMDAKRCGSHVLFVAHTMELVNQAYNTFRDLRDLDVKICVTERNQLIVDTWLDYVKDKRTVVFCASVKHAEQIAELFRAAGVSAIAVSGSMKTSERNEQLAKFASGEIKVLCACDLLNEGWDCPQTEVLFMARPTMSKVLYTQQLGRGMRTAEGKDHLMVFDFVDNASQYNMPYSLHRLFKLKDYHAGGIVVGKKGQREAEDDLYRKGEKPDAVIDYPVDATDYEVVDIFNWQEEAAGMISQMQFVRRVDVQTETIERYVREGKLVPDLIVPMSEHRTFKYFKEETLKAYAEQYGWRLIDDGNRKDLFMEMIRQMDMSYSYKPVLIKAILLCADVKGRVKLEDIVRYFRSYYEGRRLLGQKVEKANSIFAKGGYTDKEAERNILSNPFKRFEDMNMMHHTKTLGIVQVDESVWKALSAEEKMEIERICNEKLTKYYER